MYKRLQSDESFWNNLVRRKSWSKTIVDSPPSSVDGSIVFEFRHCSQISVEPYVVSNATPGRISVRETVPAKILTLQERPLDVYVPFNDPVLVRLNGQKVPRTLFDKL